MQTDVDDDDYAIAALTGISSSQYHNNLLCSTIPCVEFKQKQLSFLFDNGKLNCPPTNISILNSTLTSLKSLSWFKTNEISQLNQILLDEMQCIPLYYIITQCKCFEKSQRQDYQRESILLMNLCRQAFFPANNSNEISPNWIFSCPLHFQVFTKLLIAVVSLDCDNVGQFLHRYHFHLSNLYKQNEMLLFSIVCALIPNLWIFVCKSHYLQSERRNVRLAFLYIAYFYSGCFKTAQSFYHSTALTLMQCIVTLLSADGDGAEGAYADCVTFLNDFSFKELSLQLISQCLSIDLVRRADQIKFWNRARWLMNDGESVDNVLMSMWLHHLSQRQLSNQIVCFIFQQLEKDYEINKINLNNFQCLFLKK